MFVIVERSNLVNVKTGKKFPHDKEKIIGEFKTLSGAKWYRWWRQFWWDEAPLFMWRWDIEEKFG